MKAACAGLSLILISCSSDGYKLMRTSSASPATYEVARFVTADGDSYNRENCELAVKLFQQQPKVETKFFCIKT